MHWRPCIEITMKMHDMTMMMMVLRPKAGSLAFTPPGAEMSEVVSRCLTHRQLWVINLSKVATQWPEVDSNPRLQGTKLHHRIPPLNHRVAPIDSHCWK